MQRPRRVPQRLAASSTTSASPEAMISSACAGSVIIPTAPVAIPASRRMRRGERHLVARHRPGSPAPATSAARGAVDEIDAQRAETLARARPSRRAIQPPSTQSVAEMRTNSGSSAGHAARTALRRPRAAAACGSRRRRRTRRCAGWRAARGTRAAGSRGPRGPRSARKPAASARRAAAANACDDAVDARRRSARRDVPAVVERDRARADDRPAAVRRRRAAAPPRHGASVDALRPAWASWMPGTAPCSPMNAAMRRERLDLRVGPDAGVVRA